jgi:ubiquinone biosynthesis protein
MEIFKTGRQITQAVRNVGRLKEIVSVLGKHGFASVFQKTDLAKYLPGTTEEVDPVSLPTRTRQAFEELGPTFVKLGQLLSGRSDIIPKNFVEEFKKLQDNVRTVPFEEIENLIREELQAEIDDVFLNFDREPIASASIGQVYSATLKSGESVVVKVQRPGIEDKIKSDISILTTLATVIEKQIPEARIIGPKRIVNEFFRTMDLELDYQVEMNNCRRVKKNFEGEEGIVVPEVYSEFTTKRVLVMEKLDGVRFSDMDTILSGKFDTKKLVNIGMHALFKMIMEDGLFHGDLHAGNLFAMSGDRIGLIDYGMMGRLTQKSRDALLQMLIAIVDEDYESLCYEFLDLGEYPGSVNIEQFIRDVSNEVGPYLGLNLNEVNMGKVLTDATSVAVKHRVQIPSEWMMVFKALITIEGLGRELDPELDLMGMTTEVAKRLASAKLDIKRFTKDINWIARDLHALLQTVPRQAKIYSKKLAKNDYAIELDVRGLDDFKKENRDGFQIIGYGIIATGLMITGAMTIDLDNMPTLFNLPWLSTVCLISGLSLGIFTVTSRK